VSTSARTSGRSLSRFAVHTVLAVVAATLTMVAFAPPASAAVFTNAATITINDAPVLNAIGLASPYPSSITVSGTSGTISDLNVTLHGFSHTFSRDVDVLLTGPGGQKYLLVADAGDDATTNVTAVFDDQAGSTLAATGAWGSSGSTVTVKPSNFASGPLDSFPAPAPAGPYANADGAAATLASTFNGLSGSSVNGTWNLYVVDDGLGDAGFLDAAVGAAESYGASRGASEGRATGANPEAPEAVDVATGGRPG